MIRITIGWGKIFDGQRKSVVTEIQNGTLLIFYVKIRLIIAFFNAIFFLNGFRYLDVASFIVLGEMIFTEEIFPVNRKKIESCGSVQYPFMITNNLNRIFPKFHIVGTGCFAFIPNNIFDIRTEFDFFHLNGLQCLINRNRVFPNNDAVKLQNFIGFKTFFLGLH